MEARPMRMWMRLLTFTAVVALTAACEDSVTNEVGAVDEAALRADAALVAADGMFQDLAHMEGFPVLAGLGVGPESVGIEIQGSKSFSRTVTFFDKDGNEQPSHDPETTASMHVVSALEREVTHTFWSAAITRDRDMMITGLFGPETQRTWNGTSSGTVDRSRHPDGGVVKTYDMTSSAVISNVVRGVPRSQYKYPLSGSITRTIHAIIVTDGVEEVRDIVATITFDGDNTATMTVDEESWEINLDDRGVKKRFQKKNG
jgi:hypothetical protein